MIASSGRSVKAPWEPRSFTERKSSVGATLLYGVERKVSSVHNLSFPVMKDAHELRLAKRMARLGTETAFEVLVKARALEAKGRDIVHLEIGEPDFDTPGNIIGAATDALHKGFTHYGPSAGLPQLRETIAQYVSETRRVNATPEEVVVVPGGKPIIFFTI